MKNAQWLSRRNVLRGLGVGLALPWLESLQPRSAQAQSQGIAKTKRYVFMYFPNGVARAYWAPTRQGVGAAWSLSPLLQPLEPFKRHLQVLSNVGQSELFGADLAAAHAQLCAPTTSCTVNDVRRPILGGPSIDQVLAQNTTTKTPFQSLQLGCSTMPSYADGQHPAISRSISWAASDNPLYKEVNPQKVFDDLTLQLAAGGTQDETTRAAAALRKARDLSVLHYVNEEARSLKLKLSAADNRRLDKFLTSVEELEARVKDQGTGMGSGKTYTRPAMSASYKERADIKTIGSDDSGYNRDTHAELMNDLITMALETDLSRIVTHMLDDARSDYHYRFLKQRRFTADGSVEIGAQLDTPSQGDLLGYHALQHAGDDNDGFATVNHWFCQKFASLLQRLTAATDPDGNGQTLMDNTIVVFMSGMQGSNHDPDQLPIVLAGSGGGVFKTDCHQSFAQEVKLADVHLSILHAGFGLTQVASLGNSGGIVPALLA